MRAQTIGILLLVCSVVMALGTAPANPLGQKKEPEKKSEPAKPVDGKAAKGKALYEVWCEICHFSESTEKKIGPGLKGLFKRGKFADGRKVDDAALRTWIEKGGKDMPGFGDSIKQEEIRELIAYLKTL